MTYFAVRHHCNGLNIFGKLFLSFLISILIGCYHIWSKQKKQEQRSCASLADFEGAAAAAGFLFVMSIQCESASDAAFNSTLRAFRPLPFSVAIQFRLSTQGDGPFYISSPLTKKEALAIEEI